jgi:hypothetical protein
MKIAVLGTADVGMAQTARRWGSRNLPRAKEVTA